MSLDSYTHVRKEAPAGAPLLFLFHGTGGDETQFVTLGARLVPGAGIVAPRGDVSEFGANRFFRRAAEGVYDMADLARATDKMAVFVRAHVEGARPGAVLGLGYSNGANILASLIFTAPQLFDQAILMHPLIPFEPQIAGPIQTSFLLTAGRHDPICPPHMTDQLDASLRNAGASTELFWHDGGHEIRQEEIIAASRFFKPDDADRTEETE